jgi:hypothetical protein
MMKKKIIPLFLPIGLFLLWILCTPLQASEFYEGEQVPPAEILVQNLKILQNLSLGRRGPAGGMITLLGAHYQSAYNTYRLYYCHRSAVRNRTISNRDSDCYDDVIILPLHTNIWVMKYAKSPEWIIMTK